MMVTWLVAVPLRSTKCILNHSRAQERGRLILVEPDHQEPAGPRVCLTQVTDTYQAWSAGVIWPPPSSRLTCIWPQDRPFVGHLLDVAHDMRTFQSRSWPGISECCAMGSGLGPGRHSLESGGWVRASHSTHSGKRTVIFSSVGHATNYSQVKRLSLWVWIPIMLSTIILRVFIFPKNI